MNPNYKPANLPHKTFKPASQSYRPARAPAPATRPSRPAARADETREVLIGGVAFQSSGRSLVRKDCTPSSLSPATTYKRGVRASARVHNLPSRPTVVAATAATSNPIAPTGLAIRSPSTVQKTSYASAHAAQFTARMPGSHSATGHRAYKPKMSGRRGRFANHNMTLTNNRGPNGCVAIIPSFLRITSVDFRSIHRSARRRKFVDKPCPRFTTTGATCLYTTILEMLTNSTTCARLTFSFLHCISSVYVT